MTASTDISLDLMMSRALIYSAQSTLHSLRVLQILADKVAPEDAETRAALQALRDTLVTGCSTRNAKAAK